jgi:hypothetical protein
MTTPEEISEIISKLTINDIPDDVKYKLQKEYFKIKGRISRTGLQEPQKRGRKPKSESHKKRTRQLYAEKNKEKIRNLRLNPVGNTNRGRPKKEQPIPPLPVV